MTPTRTPRPAASIHAMPARRPPQGASPTAPRTSAPPPAMPAKPRGRFGLSTDRALGLVGVTLAAASATFGVGMTLHGPVDGFGHSGGFTVFAQLAPRRPPAEARATDTPDTGDFDDATTASIPRRTSTGAASAVTLRATDGEAATIVIGGREAVVRVGDTIPGIGAVLAIVPGARPWLRTTGGLIATAEPAR